MYDTLVTLKKGAGRTLKAGGMWVYDNEIESIAGDFENGDIVTVQDRKSTRLNSSHLKLSRMPSSA